MQGSLAISPAMPPRIGTRRMSVSDRRTERVLGEARPTAHAFGGARRAVRLTRRGRVLVQLLLLGLLAAVMVAVLGMAATGQAAPDGGGGQSEVVVQPGDSLWSVAVEHDPSRDPAATIEEIRRLNHLSGYTVHPGQTLRLP